MSNSTKQSVIQSVPPLISAVARMYCAGQNTYQEIVDRYQLSEDEQTELRQLVRILRPKKEL